jgi:DNA-binding transcriptional MerR regulator
MRIMDELSGEELADRSGVTAEQLRRLVELGIITPTPQDAFRPSDIQRIRVVDALADAGFAPEQLSQLLTTRAYNLDWAGVVFPEPTAQLTTTLEETVSATALFILIGAEPHTDWLPETILRDRWGFVLTGADLLADGRPPAGWPLERPPMLLETSLPGVFAAGDVRHGSIKRVASAVGEGSVAIRLVHEYLSHR